MEDVVPAYAISVHKSQGSEYDAIVFPVVTQHWIMLQRNLVYTALTRAKKQAIFVGNVMALKRAINNNKPVMRKTWLKDLLRQN
jgi:exodeoxyribonuclease V alpha subunit